MFQEPPWTWKKKKINFLKNHENRENCPLKLFFYLRTGSSRSAPSIFCDQFDDICLPHRRSIWAGTLIVCSCSAMFFSTVADRIIDRIRAISRSASTSFHIKFDDICLPHRRSIWAGTLIVCSAMFFSTVADRIILYRSMPVSVSIKVRNNASISLPQLTFCPKFKTVLWVQPHFPMFNVLSTLILY